MVSSFASRSEAQTVKLVESLPDGSFIVSIDGREYKALNADKIRDLQKQKIDFETAEKINAEKDSQIATQNQEIALLKKDVEIIKLQKDSFERDFNRSQEDAKRNFELFMGERQLRVEAGTFIPKGNSHGFFAKFLDAVNSTPVQMGFKLVLPIAQLVRCN